MGVPNHEIEESGRDKVLLGYSVQQVLDGKLVPCLTRKSDPQFAKEKKLGIGNSGHTLPSLS